ncbi:hypothetical protein VFPPC_18594 [Pochonia chlamydosporia 170]|uniref:Uncharacterized protein n=1 Tax=Pochonia chlamydosporia 170 TaxID=1380566 RepID=A0A219AN42_METCM|nr:hypothetical protein VFPPC_18594 [Pochonia chlamydosporia 170]OWT42258.1 hypothetical protein VFPPC_18594 [Pochonia chlamydosporia 170]
MTGAAVDTPPGSTTPAPTDLRPSVPILSSIDGEAAFRSAWANDAPGIMREVWALSQAVTNMHEEIVRLRQTAITTANTTNSHIETLQTRLSNSLMESNDKDDTISHMEGQIEAYKAIAATGGSHRHRSAEHPKPDAFSGENPKDLPEFLQKLELKLHMNRDWWADETERMGFVISCLSGDAHAQVSYNVSHGIVQFANVEAIITTLKTDLWRRVDSAALEPQRDIGHANKVINQPCEKPYCHTGSQSPNSTTPDIPKDKNHLVYTCKRPTSETTKPRHHMEARGPQSRTDHFSGIHRTSQAMRQ